MMLTHFWKILLGVGLLLSVPSVALADRDSSADVVGGFAQTVIQSDAAILRVPINQQGEEVQDQAELRVYSGKGVTNAEDLQTAFDQSVSALAPSSDTSADVSSDADSSTYGRWGWRNNYYRGYNYYNYYNYYRPYYYYGGYYYNYGYPSYYYNYYWNPYYGYRYYYYPRYW
jgi:hypothetical protein